MRSAQTHDPVPMPQTSVSRLPSSNTAPTSARLLLLAHPLTEVLVVEFIAVARLVTPPITLLPVRPRIGANLGVTLVKDRYSAPSILVILEFPMSLSRCIAVNLVTDLAMLLSILSVRDLATSLARAVIQERDSVMVLPSTLVVLVNIPMLPTHIAPSSTNPMLQVLVLVVDSMTVPAMSNTLAMTLAQMVEVMVLAQSSVLATILVQLLVTMGLALRNALSMTLVVQILVLISLALVTASVLAPAMCLSLSLVLTLAQIPLALDIKVAITILTTANLATADTNLASQQASINFSSSAFRMDDDGDIGFHVLDVNSGLEVMVALIFYL